MDFTSRPTDYRELLEAVRTRVRETALAHAPDVDAKARFPHETMAALKRVGALSAPVPVALGGLGCTLAQLSELCAAVASACGSSGMVLAMHYIQVACIVRHAGDSAFFRDYLADLVHRQHVLASITSEVGTWGDTRSSICALEREGERFALAKQATTGSYCAHADGILVTCRRDAQAPASDQVLVLVTPEQCSLRQTTTWDTLGMRGTCSPGFALDAHGPLVQVLPEPFADIAAKTMVPYSHVLWSALWSGIAGDAVGRAGAFVRAQARARPGTTPPSAQRLAEVTVELQAMRSHWRLVARECDELDVAPGGCDALLGIGWGLRFNNLKTAASEAAPRIVHAALQIVGIVGYKNDGEFSVGRHYRDVLSASLMISNDRIAAKSAAMLMVLKSNEQ